MRVKVTQEDIEKGLQDNKGNCAVALAIKSNFLINPDSVRVYKNWCQYEYRLLRLQREKQLPTQAQEFIKKFDLDKTIVEPFSFVM